jgi:hypothetical protein
MSNRNLGWWYDRLKHRYLTIQDHAIDAEADPECYRTTSRKISSIKTVVSVFWINKRTLIRDRVIRHVASRGFIRVRLHDRNLGWQFYGEPHTALAALRHFLRRHGIQRGVTVTFTDFSVNDEYIYDAALFLKDPPCVKNLLIRWERSVGRKTKRGT